MIFGGDIAARGVRVGPSRRNVPLEPRVVKGRFDRCFSAGLYFTYAPGIAKDCPSGATCSQSFTRFGLQAAYTLDRSGSLRPWFGVGVGYEWLRLDLPAGRGTLSGFEWANLQVGGDFAATARFFVGPYLAVSFGQFSDASGFPYEF